MKILSLCLLLIYSLSTSVAQDRSKPFVLGQTVDIYSSQLSENRTINIYLPEGYDPKADSVRYPVIYLLDGSADEDFIHVVGLVQFSSFEWVNRLTRSIVVGIANVDRKRDFTFPASVSEDKKLLPTSGKSGRFISFIEKDLQPYIEKNYNTAHSRTLIGESLGGLLATEILLKKPTLFNKYIIISPSLWWDNGSLLNEKSDIYDQDFHTPLDVYIGVGKEGLAPVKTPHVMEVEANVLADKIKGSGSKNITVYFDYLPDENHATIAHQAILNAFKILGARKK